MRRLCQCGHGPLYHFQKAGACHARLEEGASCKCQAFRPPQSDMDKTVQAMEADPIGYSGKPPSKTARAFWLVMLALGFLALAWLTGCSDKTPEEWQAEARLCVGKLGRYATVDGAKGWTSNYQDGVAVYFYPEGVDGGKHTFSVRVHCSRVHPVQGGVE